jgi:hypothetical protein
VIALVLLGCNGIGVGSDAPVDTTDLFPIEEGRYLAFRHFTASEYAVADTQAELDETDLLLVQFQGGGCDGEGWRIEFRHGADWEGAELEGSMHVSDASGLAVCGWEDAAGDYAAYDPMADVWVDGTPLYEEVPTESGEWSVTATRDRELATYFGVFPEVVRFSIAGPGEVGGWVMVLAPRYGPVFLVTPDVTADLVFSR